MAALRWRKARVDLRRVGNIRAINMARIAIQHSKATKKKVQSPRTDLRICLSGSMRKAQQKTVRKGCEIAVQFLRPERRIGNVDHDAQIEPVNGGFGYVQPHLSGHRVLRQRGKFTSKLKAD